MRWPRSSDSRRRSPAPHSCQRETSLARSGRCFRNHSIRAVKSGSSFNSSGSSVSTANSGISPTIERILMRQGSGRRAGTGGRNKTRPASSHRPSAPSSDAVDGGGDVEEMLEKFGRDVLIDPVVLRQFQRDAHEVQAIHRHPARAVGLVDEAAGRQRLAAVEHADVVQAEKAALKNVPALRVLAVDPPGEIQQQLVKDAFEKCQVAGIVGIFLAALFAVHLEHAPRRPGVDRRVHVAERPFVGGQLAVRMHVPFAREQHELVLGKLGVHQRQRDAVKRQVPRGIPRIFPFVGHGNDVGVVEMLPIVRCGPACVRAAAAAGPGRRCNHSGTL